ncbi:MAG: hypothetical protein HY074_15200 [Deltaproteobacteria bacterium]|nr:hypothetical protein [Deltaproteobacteria bacterium]
MPAFKLGAGFATGAGLPAFPAFRIPLVGAAFKLFEAGVAFAAGALFAPVAFAKVAKPNIFFSDPIAPPLALTFAVPFFAAADAAIGAFAFFPGI